MHDPNYEPPEGQDNRKPNWPVIIVYALGFVVLGWLIKNDPLNLESFFIWFNGQIGIPGY